MPHTTAIIPAPETSALVSARHNTNYNIAPDQFEIVISKLPDDQQETLRFWYFLGKDREWSLTQLAKSCGASSTTLSRVFRGEYGADLAKLCETLGRARESFSESADNPEFIMTALARRMFRIADRTRSLKTVSICWGPMGSGKTTNLIEYKNRNNHGRTTYYRCEPGMTLVQFITEFARANGVSMKSKQTHLRLREKLYTVLGAGNRLAIVDELHQLFLRREKSDITPILQCEFLRCVFDKAGCGMMLIGTDALDKYLVSEKEALAQLIDRGHPWPLPGKPTQADAKAFIKHFGLSDLTDREPEASAIVRDVLNSSGLRKLTLHLRDGASTAAKAGERYSWSHFITAFEDLNSLGKR